MSNILATYSFLPWLRQGIANNITQADGDTSVKIRASIPISITISGVKPDDTAIPSQQINQKIALYGPGDIVGIDSRAIIKVEPGKTITNFEANYLPYIDFYDEDFPWRYTPAKATNERLRPWITLVVLKEDEFDEGSNIKDKPLPFINLKDSTTNIFPKPGELWAWAHVHVNTVVEDEESQSIPNLIKKDPDQALSRLLCPRKLESNMRYHAFLIPTFETGRLVGLAMDIDENISATTCAWDDPSNISFPYYYRWSFGTGSVGDFEYLVNLLEPKQADKSVGVRDMDVMHIGSNFSPISNSELNGVLKLGGALRVPIDSLKDDDKAEVIKYDEWDENPYPHTFTIEMADRINLSDNDTISSPMYGKWYALQQRLLKDKDDGNLPHNKNWIHELNLDPRFRVAAGFGTTVIQKNQEEYMHAAWEQIGDVLKANNRIKFAQMAKYVSVRLYSNKFASQHYSKSFMLTAPIHSRIVHQQQTIKSQVSESLVPPALLSGTFRAITRPRGKTFKKLTFTNDINPFNILERVNNGEVVASPPKKDPGGAINLSDILEENKPAKIPAIIAHLLKKYKWFKFTPLILLLLLLLLFKTSLISLIALLLVALYVTFDKWDKQLNDVGGISQEKQSPELVDTYTPSPDFIITEPGTGVKPSRGNTDSREAIQFKAALKDVFALVNTTYKEPKRESINIGSLNNAIIEKINPSYTIPRRTFSTIKLPKHIIENMTETFAPIKAHPVIDIPMYKPLADISSELFLPNLNKIEHNSITLLENNQKFIESYMVGINHEMTRELLWREYPIDYRGTYFRQFWDANDDENIKDIPPIHKWSRVISPNELGTHNLRAAQSGKTQLVLVIRGELLKKYPTAVVYAQKAVWGKKNNVEDVNEERALVEIPASEQNNPPKTLLKTPVFEAKIEPDVYFFGFDLDDEEARGTKEPKKLDDDPGWFFVLKERPGEARFGLDIEKSEKITGWNNLSWKDVGTTDNKYIQLNKTINLEPASASTDDQQARWSPSTNSAELAYILYQVPVMVAIHASKMLP